MAEEQILIKFKPSGDKELIDAIKKLSVETNKLTGSKGLGGTTVAAKKFSNAAANLTAKLKVQNVTWKQLGISGEILKKAYKSNRIALEKLRIAMAGSNAQSLIGVRNNRLLANSFATLRSKLLLVSFGAMLVERAFVSLVKTHGRQEAANEKLAVGLTNVQDTTEGVTQRLIDYSSALQKVTAFGDEMITTGMVQFTTFGLNEEAIKALTPQVLNVARAIQTTSGAMPDLNSLFIAFGKATSTGIGTLTRYGVVLTAVEKAQLDSMDANESAVKIAEILDRQYGGLAEAYAKTTSGMLEAASAARGDAAEAFGKVLAPAVLAASEGLKALFEATSPERITRFGTAVGIAAVAFGLLNKNVRKAVIGINLMKIAQTKLGWGAIATVVGSVSFAIMEYLDVFADVSDEHEDYEKRLEKLTGAKHLFTEQVYAAIAAINAEKEAFSMLLPLDKKELDAKEKMARLYQRLEHMKKGMSETDIKLLEISRGRTHVQMLWESKLISEIDYRTKLLALDISQLNLGKGELTALEKKITTLNATKAAQEEFNKAVRENAKIVSVGGAEIVRVQKEQNHWLGAGIRAKAEFAKKDLELQLQIRKTMQEEEQEIVTLNKLGQIVKVEMNPNLRELLDTRKELEAQNKVDVAYIGSRIAAADNQIQKTREEIQSNVDMLESLREIAGVNKLMAGLEPPKSLKQQERAILDDPVTAALLTGEEVARIEEHFRELKFEKDSEAIKQGLDMSLNAIGGLLSAQQGKLDAEMAAMKAGDKFQNASSKKREAMETAMQEKQALARNDIAKKEKIASVAQATMSVYESVVAALGAKPYGAWNIGLALGVGALGFAQVNAIASTPLPKFEAGGMIGGRRHSQGGTMIEAERGEFVMSRSAVNSVGLENLNRMNEGGGGSSVTVNVSGNVMSQDFVEGELAGQIKDAIRRGTDFGIS